MSPLAGIVGSSLLEVVRSWSCPISTEWCCALRSGTDGSHALARLGRGDSELGQKAAVVGLHPLLGQLPAGVVPEGTDHFPLEVLPSGLDWTDGRVGEDPGEIAGERRACRQEPAVADDLLADDP